MRIIDADALLKCIPYEDVNSRFAVQNAPTIEERKKGKWKLLSNGDAICSECGHTQKCAWDFDNWDNYCHFCGSDNMGE